MNDYWKQNQLLFDNLGASEMSVVVTEPKVNKEGAFAIVYVNDAYTRMTGYTLNEVADKDPRICQGKATSSASKRKIRSALAAAEPVRSELLNYRKDGQEFWLDLHIMPLFDDAGKLQNFYSIGLDITHAKTHLAHYLRIIHDQSCAFEMFAHDLRSPMSTMLSFTQLLRDEAPEMTVTNRVDYAEQLEFCSQSVLDLLENMIWWYKSLHETIEPHPDWHSLKSVLDAALKVFHLAIVMQKITINNQVDVDQEIFADSLMIQSIFRNLIGNAIRQTPQGSSLTFSAKTTASGVILVVEDEGPGMPDEIRDYIMHGAETRPLLKRCGTSGLGLGICRNFMLAHRGSIHITSGKPRGCRIELLFPNEG